MKRATQWPADKVERWPLDRIIPDARNPRTHSDAQIAQIAASMQEWGWTIPLLVDESGKLIAGHGRVLAARQLDLDEAPVMVARGWSETQKRAYRIADNKLSINAGWDVQLLSGELAELVGAGLDAGTLGFSDADMARLADDTDRIMLSGAAETVRALDPTSWQTSNPTFDMRPHAAMNSNTGVDAQATAVAPPVPAEPGIALAMFSCVIAVADRPILFDAIAQAKARGAPDSGAALVNIAREWMQS